MVTVIQSCNKTRTRQTINNMTKAIKDNGFFQEGTDTDWNKVCVEDLGEA